MRRVEHVSDILRGFLNNKNLDKQIRRWSVVIEWPSLVGDEIADHSKAFDLIGGILWVSVPSSSWRQHIMFLKPQILKAIAKKFPTVSVSDIRCVTSPRRINE